jgi:hypothetical protein
MVTSVDPESEGFFRIEDVFTQEMVNVSEIQRVHQNELQAQHAERMKFLKERPKDESPSIPKVSTAQAVTENKQAIIERVNAPRALPARETVMSKSEPTANTSMSSKSAGASPRVSTAAVAEDSDADDSDVSVIDV